MKGKIIGKMPEINSIRYYLRTYLLTVIIVIALLMCVIEGVKQYQDNLYVKAVAGEVVAKAGAVDARQKVLALRDYLRQNVSYYGAPYEDRPFFRDSAADTIKSQKGYCGEVTRAFVCLAQAVGVPARRVNLYGRDKHVVAEAELSPDERVVVDNQNPPQIAELETLDHVILHPEYDNYYTINLRRLHINWLISRITLEISPVTYWLENPHALKAAGWFFLGGSLLLLKMLRKALRAFLRRRGWIHSSSVELKQLAVAAGEAGISQ